MREGNVMPDEGFTELAGPRVALRRFHSDDLAKFVAYRSSEQVARFQSWDAPYPREEGERFIQEIAKQDPDTPGEWFQFAVVLRSTGHLIGDCAAMPHADDPRQCDIGFTISAEHQGHGYATEAVRLLLNYLFTERGKHRITAYCDPRNAASVALLERLGMRAGRSPAGEHLGQGEWTDDLVYALLPDEWKSGS
jgi:RimJ/RimL family protein N-acetyltransferase